MTIHAADPEEDRYTQCNVTDHQKKDSFSSEPNAGVAISAEGEMNCNRTLSRCSPKTECPVEYCWQRGRWCSDSVHEIASDSAEGRKGAMQCRYHSKLGPPAQTFYSTAAAPRYLREFVEEQKAKLNGENHREERHVRRFGPPWRLNEGQLWGIQGPIRRNRSVSLGSERRVSRMGSTLR